MAAAEALRRRTAADLVVANSVCATVQVLVNAQGSTAYPTRAASVAALAGRIAAL